MTVVVFFLFLCSVLRLTTPGTRWTELPAFSTATSIFLAGKFCHETHYHTNYQPIVGLASHPAFEPTTVSIMKKHIITWLYNADPHCHFSSTSPFSLVENLVSSGWASKSHLWPSWVQCVAAYTGYSPMPTSTTARYLTSMRYEVSLSQTVPTLDTRALLQRQLGKIVSWGLVTISTTVAMY